MSRMRNLVESFTRKPAANGETESTVRPVYEIKETPEAWGLTALLPGVTKDGLELTAEEGLITIRGGRQWKAPSGWTTLYRESSDAAFELSLAHDNTIDVNRIHAELKDGVLRVSLPKAEAIKPRKIAVS
jgi:HSP20 family protein